MIRWGATISATGSQPTRGGTITATRAHGTHWRATFYERGSGKRVFGSTRKNLGETVALLLDNINVARRLARGERDRILGLALRHGCQPGSQPTAIPNSSSAQHFKRPAGPRHQLYQRPCSANAGLGRPGSEPPPSAPGLSATSSNVRWVHQMYGCFRDNKPMNARFLESKRRWEQVAVTMGARYHLWNADEVDTLVKTRFGFLWEAYQNVRYPVMRADIGRVAILYDYGGLYSDLDVFPNRCAYRQVPFAVCMRPNRSKKLGSQPTFLDMQVLVGRVNHPLLWEWLHFMAREMKRLQYNRGFWRRAKMRYVYNTTGPVAMQRFLRLPANQTWSADISYVQGSTSEEGDDNSARDLQRYDVVSCTSNTYFTKEHRIVVGVTALAAPLPPRAAPLRCKRKPSPSPRRAPSQLVRANTPHRRTANIAAARQEADANAAIEATAAARAGAGTATPAAAASEHAVLQIAAASAEAAAAVRARDEAIGDAADAHREKDAAVEEAIAARRERDAAIAQAAAASSRADTWAAVAVFLQNTAAGYTYLQSCPYELIEEVRNPTETVRNQALSLHRDPPRCPRP